VRAILEAAGYRNYEYFHWSRDPSRWSYVSLDHYFGHADDVLGFGAGAQSFITPDGNLEMLEMDDFLTDPLTMKPGKRDLEFTLERALGCRYGLQYKAIARTFGMTEAELQSNALLQDLALVPGVVHTEQGLVMAARDYMREHTIGVQSRMSRFLALPEEDQQRIATPI
jgi:coproporphyrinogen III oxidase-like Fe-S oxidoreductase